MFSQSPYFALEQAGPSNNAVDFVALREQQFGEVGAVLAGEAGD
jgi:hypothetical protein